MRKDRRFRAQRAIEQHLLRSVGNVVGAANHVSDAHIDVVDHHAHLVHGLAEFFVAFSGTQQNEILDFFVGKLAFTKDRVEKFRRFAKGNFETHRRLRPGRRWLAIAARTARDAAPRPLSFLVLPSA